MNGGEERAEYTVYMEAETDAGGVSMVWGLSGVGVVWARGMHGCFREGCCMGVVMQVCACAWGTHIATRHHTPRRLLLSHRHSVCRLALREGVRHVVHLPLPEGC
jgi:hypothetical protein